jgi:hypothetical protein
MHDAILEHDRKGSVSMMSVRLPRVLNPVERISEILFGLIMTLSITGTISVMTGGQEELGAILWGVVGCNIAWGAIDAILYLLAAISENNRANALLRLVIEGKDRDRTRAVIAEVLPPSIAGVMHPEELDVIGQRLVDLPVSPRRRAVRRQDMIGATGVFLLVVLSCVPLIAPFLIIADPRTALRVSNAVALVMLFFGGYVLATYSGLRKVPTGAVLVVLGVLMVALTIALGG